MKFLNKLILILFHLVFFLVPLLLWPFSYEIFEFNKIVAVYILTLLIVSSWAIKTVIQRKIIFRRTILDIPLLIFLGTQLISTLISIDIRTSLFGYYSRFNGGFLSTLSFTLLYFAFVSNINSKKTISFVKSLIFSSFLICTFGTLEHFGIDENIWVQDVKERVFSSLGQPNWLAAWIVAIIPLTWAFLIKKQKLVFGFLSLLLFSTLLFTKSRSGFLGFGIAFLVFWGGIFFLVRKYGFQGKTILKTFFTLNALFLIINLFTRTPWTPNFSKILSKNSQIQVTETQETTKGTVLETGGTESGTIRKLVWQGALDTWKAYPILGSGVETFALSFYQFRPKEHNLVSEWDFLYNKAHNEYLNFLATSGSLGFLSYITLIGMIIYVFVKNILREKNKILNLSLLSGFVSILVTNFFGFSVVPINLQFFLFPAICISLKEKKDNENTKNNVGLFQKLQILLILSFALFLLLAIVRYWLADLNFAKAKRLDDAGIYTKAREYLQISLDFSSKEALYWAELAENSVNISLALSEEDKENSEAFLKSALEETKMAEKLSPVNLGILRQITTVYIKLSEIDINYLFFAKEYLEKSVLLSPNDAKLIYNLGLIYSNTVDTKKAIETIEKAIELKENYKQARSALATLYLKENEIKKAKEQLKYILEKIDPTDKTVQERYQKIEAD